MHKFSLLTVLFLVLLLSGCRHAPYLPYHSMASIPQYSTAINTDMTFVEGSQKKLEGRKYAVIAAVDDDTIPYLLFAPANASSRSVTRLEDVNFGYASYLTVDEASRFIDILNQVLVDWNQNQGMNEGAFYEFYAAPEPDIKRISPNVLEWEPSVRFTCNRTDRGVVASLLLGSSETIKFLYTFRDDDEVADLKNLLQQGISLLPTENMPVTQR